jgi:sulfoquinovosidase
MKKKTLWILITAAIMILAVFAALHYGKEYSGKRPLIGKLTGPATPVRLENGRFLLSWNDGIFAISRRDNPTRLLFSNQAGKSFVGAAMGIEKVEEARGSFFVSDTITRKYPDQTIEKIQTSARDGFAIEGKLAGKGTGSSTGYSLRFIPVDDNSLEFSLSFTEVTINRSYLTLKSHSEERLYGFGVQFTYIDMKGRYLPVLISEQGLGRGRQPLTAIVDLVARSGGTWYTSYAAVPHFFSSDLRSLHLTGSSYCTFDMRDDDRIQISSFSQGMRGMIISAESPKELLERYTGRTGRMRTLPEWVHRGAIIGMQGGTEKVRAVYEKLKKNGTPIAAFWLQDWVGQRLTSFGKQLWWNWQLDKQRYPGWPVLHPDFTVRDIRVLGYINPFLVDTGMNQKFGRNLYAESIARGYVVKTREGEPCFIPITDFSAVMLDLTNPEAVKWIKEIIRTELAQTGMRGWMADFGEALPWDAVLYSGEKASEVHNRYPELWARINREVIDSLPGSRDYLFFMRAGYTKSPAWSTLFWLGDQMVTWDEYDGLKSAVTGLLSSGFSGFSLQHSDIGGYTALRSPVLSYFREKELLLRWIELNAFSTVFRTHEGNRPDDNFQFYSDDEALAHFSRFAKIYEAWGFYRKELVNEASRTGMPVVRHLYFEYPADKNVSELRYECFMIGSEFLMAPVTDKGATKVRAYLPAGSWRHLWSGKLYSSKGAWQTFDAPIGKPAVFYKDGSQAGERFRQNLKGYGLL